MLDIQVTQNLKASDDDRLTLDLKSTIRILAFHFRMIPLCLNAQLVCKRFCLSPSCIIFKIMIQQKYFLRLNEDGAIEASPEKIIYLCQDAVVQIQLDNRKQAKYPVLLERQNYKKVALEIDCKTDFKKVSATHKTTPFQLNESGDWIVDVQFQLPGSAYLRVIWLDQLRQIDHLGVINYIIVEPPIAQCLKESTIQTVLPYCLGKLDQYYDQIASQVNCGYGAFHLPPIQKLGQSPSLYAIADQHKLNPDIFGSATYADLKALFDRFPNQLFFVDILLNHTAFDSEWLNNPEFESATYNAKNSPHLEVAIRLDNAIADFSNSLGAGQVPAYPRNRIENEHDLDKVLWILETDVVKKMNLWEYFQFDLDTIVESLGTRFSLVESKTQQLEDNDNIFIESAQELLFALIRNHTILKGAKRFGVSLNMNAVAEFFGTNSNNKRISKEFLREVLTHFNQLYRQEADGYISEAMHCTKGQIKWWKLTRNNPEVKTNQKGDSLVPRYFTQLKNGAYVANNGWIQGFDPLKNFAENQEHHYLRRTIVIWGDLVKLRYGASKKDCPALWKYMKQYVQEMSKLFQGLRLDNAHSTPLAVGEYMMRKARKVNPKILVFAELFTGSVEKDSIFTKQLGINCLVRETNRCYKSGDLNRELHFYSGEGLMAIGSLPQITEHFKSTSEPHLLLQAQYAPALVYEQSHDNESIVKSHGFGHQLPLAALISFGNCMGGTVRGYDIYVKERLSVVNERRVYSLDEPKQVQTVSHEATVTFRVDLAEKAVVQVYGSWDQWMDAKELEQSSPGIYVASIKLPVGTHEYKYKIGAEWKNVSDKEVNLNGNHEISVTHKAVISWNHNTLENLRKKLNGLKKELNTNYQYIFTQNHGDSLQSIIREAADHTNSKILIAVPSFGSAPINATIQLPGRLVDVDFIAYNSSHFSSRDDNKFILPSEVEIREHANLFEHADIYINHSTKCHYLKFTNLPTSFVCVLSCRLDDHHQHNLRSLQEDLRSEQMVQFNQLASSEINYLLFSSEQEEQEINGSSLYHVPNYRQLVYAGYAGPRSALREAAKYNNLAHPICENLRNGNWLIDYLANRVSRSSMRQDFKEFIARTSEKFANIPRYLIPRYFTIFVEKIYNSAMFSVSKDTSQFLRELHLASYQFLANMPHSILMSAGLPHFTSGWARSWGRDTFISFRGIYLENHLFKEAREAILTYGSCLRHGLIPNLLDGCRSPRYNCRDACWWYIKAIKDYIEATKSSSILQEKVKMVFLSDDIEKHEQLKAENKESWKTVEEIIQCIFQSHATGIKFREWRAGFQIDQSMSSDGFNITLHLDEETGFIVGGSWLNCLTWMDKMGSSEYAGNKGIPATSRDGAPIELTALLKVCLDFVANLHAQKWYAHEGVSINHRTLSFKEWSSFISKNFEKYYWVPNHLSPEYHVIEKHVRHRQIYKDLCKSSKPRNEYQLRCNASIAIGLAPELFNKDKAKYHLAAVEAYLIKPKSLGIKTLDPQSSEYVHYYDNSDQSKTFNLAHGFSYHNGPEWVWVYGYFLKALHVIHGKAQIDRQFFYSYLSNHKQCIHNNEWYSLPEMTNGDGEYNVYSCRAQAWSIACLLEAIVDYEKQLQ